MNSKIIKISPLTTLNIFDHMSINKGLTRPVRPYETYTPQPPILKPTHIPL